MRYLIIFAYLFTILYTGTAHSYSKVCIVLSKYLDVLLNLPPEANNLALAMSTFAGAFGKIIGSYFERFNIVKLSGVLFLVNAVFICGCIWPINIEVFLFSRTMQGLVSGMQGAISFGCLGLLSDNKVGFANFTGIGAVFSCITLLIISLFNANIILYSILVINICTGLLFLFFFRSVTYKRNFTVIFSSVLKCISNASLWVLSLSIGFLLGIALVFLSLQKPILSSFFGFSNNSMSTLAGMGQFIIGFFASIFYKIQNIKSVMILFVATSLCFYFSFLLKNALLFIFANSLAFGIFALAAPIVANIATRILKDPYVISTYFFGMRSIFTSITIGMASTFNGSYLLMMGLSGVCILMIISIFQVYNLEL